MKDDELIERFEACTLRPDEFRHRDHVKMAWLYLRRYSTIEALSRFSEALKRFAGHLGKPDLYHETITWGHIFLIHERMLRSSDVGSWLEFEAANADLFDWQNGIIKQMYGDAVITSETARQIFVLPTRSLTTKP